MSLSLPPIVSVSVSEWERLTRRDKAYLSSLKKLVRRVAAVPSSIFRSTMRGDS